MTAYTSADSQRLGQINNKPHTNLDTMVKSQTTVET